MGLKRDTVSLKETLFSKYLKGLHFQKKNLPWRKARNDWLRLLSLSFLLIYYLLLSIGAKIGCLRILKFSD